MKKTKSPCTLDEVIATAELRRRPGGGRVDSTAESQAFLKLTRALAASPRDFFGQLVQSALALSGAGSTGISLLNKEEGRFVWPAVAGKLDCYLGSGTPADFGPCGTVLERQASLLFIHPERHFTYLIPINPPLEEVLLIPFDVNGKLVGTLWAVNHERERQFTEDDRLLLERLSQFASSAYRALANSGALQPLLDMRADA